MNDQLRWYQLGSLGMTIALAPEDVAEAKAMEQRLRAELAAAAGAVERGGNRAALAFLIGGILQLMGLAIFAGRLR